MVAARVCRHIHASFYVHLFVVRHAFIVVHYAKPSRRKAYLQLQSLPKQLDIMRLRPVTCVSLKALANQHGIIQKLSSLRYLGLGIQILGHKARRGSRLAAHPPLNGARRVSQGV